MCRDYTEIQERLEAVRSSISRIRLVDEIRIVAVTKTHTSDAVRAGLLAGLCDFGENYAIELRDKAIADYPNGSRINWHFIGGIQRNKLSIISRYASMIETVARKVEISYLVEHGYRGQILVQVAPEGAEETRNGAAASEVPALVESARHAGLRVVGLMGMALPGTESQIGHYFAGVRRLGDSLDLKEFSMGMSSDYLIAVAEGATMIRLGSVLFGARAL